jgi:hypothetical protein
VGLSWRLGLLWIQGFGGSRELQAHTTVDYGTTLTPQVRDLYEQIALDLYNSVSLEDLESNGWLKSD